MSASHDSATQPPAAAPGRRGAATGRAPLQEGCEARVILSRSGARMTVRTGTGDIVSGLDFATQDYLGLGVHPTLREAALQALTAEPGLHPTGPAPLTGLSVPMQTLESRLAEFLHTAQATVFPSGSEANRAAMRALLRPGDHLILDAEAHVALAEAACAQGARVHRSPPGSTEAVERRLRRLRTAAPQATLVVAVSAISATSARWADLPALITLCRAHQATLVVDVTHDLGAMGPGGRGLIEVEGCLGRIDVVTGSLAKTFGAAGGFVASRDRALATALRVGHGGQGQTTATTALQAAIVLRALDIVASPDGAARRRRLSGHVRRLRNQLSADGWTVLGQEAPFVPVRLPVGPGPRLDPKRLTAALDRAGLLVTLLAAPVVAGHAPRWRLQLRADHGAADIDALATGLRRVTRATQAPRAAGSGLQVIGGA